MYSITEDEVYSIEQLKNKVTVFRTLSELGGNQVTQLTSEQIATVFIEIEDQLNDILASVQTTIQVQTLTEPSE